MRTLTNDQLDVIEEEIHEALEAETLDTLRERLALRQPADLADVLERLDPEEATQVFDLLTDEQQIDLLHELGSDTTRNIFSNSSTEDIAALLNQMPMDDVADILTDDVPEREAELLEAMQPDDAEEVRTLLQYPQESAGRLMTEKYARIEPEWTVDEAIAHLRKVDPEVETVSDLYIVDADEHLVGVVSLRKVITAPPGSRIQSLMETEVISVPPEMDQEEAARLFSRYDFLAMPVVNAQRQMLGIITVDDIIHVLVEESTEDALKFSGIEGGLINQPYFTVPIRRVIRTRIGWLLLLFLAETLTGSVLRIFEVELEAVVALSFFIPLLIGTGGNTGAQTVSTIIRGIAIKEIRASDSLRVVRRELTSGVIIGIILGTVAFFRTILWGGLSLSFCLVIGLTILVICTWANTIGSIIPLVAQRLKIDPAVVSAPLITTLVDATGLAIYLLIAKALLNI